MAIKTKTQLHADVAALPNPITPASLVLVLDDMVDSYEDIIQEYTTAARNGLTPVQGQKIFNTDNKRLEIYSGTAWLPCSQKDVVALDASSNPNYVQGGVGDQYVITVAGKVGGSGGKSVYVNDLVYCVSENAGGTEASVGTSWKVCHSQGVSDTPTYYAEVSLTSADILALNSSPITIVSATGAGTIIIPLEYVIQYTHVTTAYSAVAVESKYAAAAASIGGLTNVLDGFVASAVVLANHTSLLSNRYYANSALQVWAASNPTTGDGTMKVGVYYKIHTL